MIIFVLMWYSPYGSLGIKLATVPNVDVLLNEELFMEVLKPEEVSYTFRLRLAKNFGMPFVSTQLLYIVFTLNIQTP